MANLQRDKWTAIFMDGWNGTKNRADIADQDDLQGLRTSVTSEPNTPPGQVDTRVWVPTDEIKALLDSKPQFQIQGEWEEIVDPF